MSQKYPQNWASFTDETSHLNIYGRALDFILGIVRNVLSWRSSTRGSAPEMHPFKVKYRPFSFFMVNNLEEPTFPVPRTCWNPGAETIQTVLCKI